MRVCVCVTVCADWRINTAINDVDNHLVSTLCVLAHRMLAPLRKAKGCPPYTIDHDTMYTSTFAACQTSTAYSIMALSPRLR